MSKNNGKNNSNSNTKNFLISKNKTSRFSAALTVMPSQTLYVSLDNADTVIDGCPAPCAYARGGGASTTYITKLPPTQLHNSRFGTALAFSSLFS
jgi:hypothetical protein